MTDVKTDPAAALRQQHAELAVILDALAPEDWRRDSMCAGWDVADVVLHLAQTDEAATASLRGTLEDTFVPTADADDFTGVDSVDAGADLLVARERGAGPAAIHARWREASKQLDDAVTTTDPHTRVRWIIGEFTARTLVTTRLAEAWIHTGDITDALGIHREADDRLWHIARLAWRTLPHAFAREDVELSGPVAFELHGAGDGTWTFTDGDAATTVTGSAVELCRLASRRIDASETSLVATGPDGEDVLRLVRTWA